MDQNNIILSEMTIEERKTVQGYIRLSEIEQYAEKILLGLVSSSSFRKEGNWEFIAIKFRPETKQSKMIEAVVNMRADEYHGVEDGFHLFWYD